MKEFLVNTNPNTLYLIGGILAIIVVIAIILKAIKTAVFISTIVVVFLFFGPKSAEMQEKYNVKYDEGIVVVTINGETHEIKAEDMKNVRVEKREDGDSYVVYMDNEVEKTIKIPSYMVGVVTDKLQDMTKP